MLGLAVHAQSHRAPQFRAYQLEEPMPEPTEFSDHFLPSDRRELIQTGERLASLKEDFAELKRTIESTHRDHDGLIRRIESGLKADVKELDSRTRALENFRWWIVGAAAASGATAGFISRFFHP
jgi:hypothetical protein